MTNRAILASLLMGLCTTFATSQVQETKVPRPPQVGPDIKTLPQNLNENIKQPSAKNLRVSCDRTTAGNSFSITRGNMALIRSSITDFLFRTILERFKYF